MSSQRLDAAIVSRGIASGREKAKELIAGGGIKVNGRRVTKPSLAVMPDDEITVEAGFAQRYVGRGGYKLEKALQLGASPDGKICLDVGASTGGFTDCMLQYGAKKVYALDVGHGQLHESLRSRSDVVNMEGLDIRNIEKICKIIPPASVQFCSVDVSFISIRKIINCLPHYLEEGAEAVLLIKPQFEAGRAAVGKRGVVRDPAAHRAVLRDILDVLQGCRFTVDILTFSPIAGGDGNIEYLALTRYTVSERAGFDVDAVVAEAFRIHGRSMV